MAAPIILAEAMDGVTPSASVRDILASTAAARLAGGSVYTIPPDFERCGDAEGALWHIPAQARPTPTFWIGYIPTPERYADIYDAGLRKNLVLPNTLDQHRNAQEFDRAYPRLGDLTPDSTVIYYPDEAASAIKKLGFPVFVKGAVQSRKSRGWRACVAETVEELQALTRSLLERENRSRGRVIVRQLIPLRHVRRSPAQDFPLGREFRVFLWNGEIVGLGYYWEGDDPLSMLSPAEEERVRSLAKEAATRVATPYIAVDIGQEESGKWWVIETGDAQFSGLSRISALIPWHKIVEASRRGG